MIEFEKPVGAHADCKELEYISALHQSSLMLRQDASITAEDVVNFLLSRHGIKADLTYVERNLMPGLAGNIDESPDAVFDLVELASILLIPHLRKTGAEHDCEIFFDKVLKMITLDVTGSSDPVRLDRTMMLNIMKTYGEEDVSSAVVDEMLKAAGVQKNGSTMFDYKKLVNATTADIQQYDPEWETRETTYYDDVLDGTSLDANLEDNDPDEELAKSNFDDALTRFVGSSLYQRLILSPRITGPNFQCLALGVRCCSPFQYASDFDTSVGQQDCPTTSFMSEFGCRVGQSIVAWLMLMVQLIILGTIFVILSTAGNSIHLQHNLPSFVGVMLGIVTIMFSSMLSYIFEVKFFLINTNKSSSAEGQFGYGFALALGCVLLFQIKSLLYVLIPRSTWKNLPFANFWLTCEMAKSECCTKQAAAYKIKNMVDHAFAQHDGSILRKAESARVKLKASSFKSANAKAMMSFHATADHRERVGGILYTFRRMWNGSCSRRMAFYPRRTITISDAPPPTTRASPSASPAPLQYWFPTETEVRFSIGLGCVTAFLAAASLALVWIPSSVSTIQQFRCGNIGSLRCRFFPTYRFAPDVTTILLGSTFWGTLYTSLSVLIMVGSITFLLVWSVTRSLVIKWLATIIAILLTLFFKILLLTFVRKFIFVGFFRRESDWRQCPDARPRMLVAWANVGNHVFRTMKLLLVTSFILGDLIHLSLPQVLA
ncbi:hypothetical protein MHU86_20954 [Fragilaria crotonensis]|nr:hypothetical protein MHU86_20954 [Fragilaria crotonensis]